MLRKTIMLIFTFILLFLMSNAYAASIKWPNFVTSLGQDLSSEYLLNYQDDGSYSTDDGDLELNENDRLRGHLRIDSIQNQDSGETFYQSGSESEFTAVFDLQVIEKDFVRTDNQGVDRYDFTFGSAGTLGDDGSVVSFYLDDDPNWTQFLSTSETDDVPGNAKEEELIAKSTDGDHYWSFGFTGAGGDAQGGEGWKAFDASDDLSIFQNFFTDEKTGGIFKVALNLTDNPLGPQLIEKNYSFSGDSGRFTYGDGSPVHLTGSGDLFGIGRDANDDGLPDDTYVPMDVSNQFVFEVQAVPEPTTLLLFGTGLLGLAAFGRKKFMKKS